MVPIGTSFSFLAYLTQVVTYLFSLRSNSTPLECDSLNAPFSIDIAPLRGEESAKKTLLKRSKPVSSNLGYLTDPISL